MCFVFHKWSNPTKELWEVKTLMRGIPITGTEKPLTRFSQERTCQKCGKYQKRFVHNE